MDGVITSYSIHYTKLYERPHRRLVCVSAGGYRGGQRRCSRRQPGHRGHRLPSLERGVALGVIDDYTLDLDEALARADILVLAAPTLVTAELLRDILPRSYNFV